MLILTFSSGSFQKVHDTSVDMFTTYFLQIITACDFDFYSVQNRSSEWAHGTLRSTEASQKGNVKVVANNDVVGVFDNFL